MSKTDSTDTQEILYYPEVLKILTCLTSGIWSMPMSFTIWFLMAAIFLALLTALLVLPMTSRVVTLVTSFTRHILLKLAAPELGLKWQVLQVRH